MFKAKRELQQDAAFYSVNRHGSCNEEDSPAHALNQTTFDSIGDTK